MANDNGNNDKAILAQLQAKIAELEAQNQRLAAKRTSAGPRELSFKVGVKGGVSVYGLSRFPVTLYGSQWERLIAAIPQIQAFMAKNSALLKTKDTPAEAVAA